MINIRPIRSSTCYCKLCKKQISKNENAYVFQVRIRGEFSDVHLHLNCVTKMQEEVMLWHYNERLKNENTNFN